MNRLGQLLMMRGNLPLAMHIPDGLLSVPVSVVTGLLAIVWVAVCLHQVRATYQDRAVPLMGVCAAFIFAAQMITFPIPGGTSGHLLGGTLAGVLLGPWAGSLVMTVVFMVQALLFQDGGVLVLGANITNMGLVGTFLGYYLYRSLRMALGRDRLRSVFIAAAIAAWVSVFVGSLACAVELALSGTVPLTLALGAMAFWHAMIGLGEAVITVIAVSYLCKTRPDLLYKPPVQLSMDVPRGFTPR